MCGDTANDKKNTFMEMCWRQLMLIWDFSVKKLTKEMFGSAGLLLNTSRYLDIDNVPVLCELGESQECYVVIRHDMWLCFVRDTTPEIKSCQEGWKPAEIRLKKKKKTIIIFIPFCVLPVTTTESFISGKTVTGHFTYFIQGWSAFLL